MNSRRFTWLLVPVALALAFFTWRARDLGHMRAHLSEAREGLAELTRRADEREATLRSAQSQYQAERRLLQQTAWRASGLAGQASQSEASVDWSRPPAELPAWDSHSPYVWIDKPMLAQLPVPVFANDGSIASGMAELLALPPEKRAALNQATATLLADHRRREAQRARRILENSAGAETPNAVDRITVQIEPDPESAAQTRRAFLEALQTHIGGQRAELIAKSATDWLNAELGGESPLTKTISVNREPDGFFRVQVKTANSSMSTTGSSFENYVAAHLRELFEPLLGEPQSSP